MRGFWNNVLAGKWVTIRTSLINDTSIYKNRRRSEGRLLSTSGTVVEENEDLEDFESEETY
jgi:hypothetical protein